MSADDWEMVEEEIFAPLVLSRRDPDNVSQSVIDSEMELFAAFSAQSRALEG